MHPTIVITYADIGRNYNDLLWMAFESARLRGYKTILVTNKYCDYGQDRWYEEPLIDELMPWILRAQRHYMKNSVYFAESNTGFISPDTLINRPLDKIFEQDFDVAVTMSSQPDYPINNGVIYLKPNPKCIKLWDDMIERCENYEPRFREWYGDQKAVHEILSESHDKPYGLKIKRFPAFPYNASFSPKVWTGGDDLSLMSAYILHFKGDRKERMRKFWNVLKNRMEISSQPQTYTVTTPPLMNCLM